MSGGNVELYSLKYESIFKIRSKTIFSISAIILAPNRVKIAPRKKEPTVIAISAFMLKSYLQTTLQYLLLKYAQRHDERNIARHQDMSVASRRFVCTIFTIAKVPKKTNKSRKI